MSNKTGECRLCRQTAILRSSHIFPKFCYKSLRDEKGKIIRLSSAEQGDLLHYAQHGGICEDLLCDSCEQQFGKYEEHAAKLLREESKSFGRNPQNYRLHPNIEYKRMKLFCLSVLWRCSVSCDSFFKRVRLGPHESTIRTMLLAEDPGAADAYATVLFSLHIRGEPLDGLLSQPGYARLASSRWYMFVMCGFLVAISVGSRPAGNNLLRLAISPGLPIKSFDAEVNDFAFLRNARERLRNARN